jgi:hypothetical protein
MYDFKIRQVYSFDVHPVAILGTDFKNVTVLGVVDQETANQWIDTHAFHINVFPFLPAGTPNQPDGYNYLKIKTQSGAVTVIGMAWIKEDTIQSITSTKITVTLEQVTPDDVPRIRSALAQNGFNSMAIKVS